MARKVDPVLGSVLVRVPQEAESKIRVPVQVINWGSDPHDASSCREWAKWDGKEQAESEDQANDYA